jgi:CarboxypepD_reg-like domain/Carboxypeptidase regulatory-like domain
MERAMRLVQVRGVIAVFAGVLVPAVLQAQVELRGRLVSDSGVPIASATVTVSGPGFSIRSDSLGRFVLAGAPGAVLSLRFLATGYRADTASIALGRRPVERDFTLVRDDAPEPERNPSTSVLRGRVIDEAGQPLSYANIQVNFGRRFVSDDSGRFQVPSTVSGGATILVRRIGFEPAEVKFEAMPDTALRVQLKAIPVQLKGVVVTGASAYRSLDTYGFYRRMQDVERGINHGWFITPEDLERRKPNFITQMAEGFPSVRIGGPQGRPRSNPRSDVIQGLNGCPMSVYLDNIRIVGRIGGRDDSVNEIALPTHVAAMEIYPRGLGAPPQYRSGTCGVVLIWTK